MDKTLNTRQICKNLTKRNLSRDHPLRADYDESASLTGWCHAAAGTLSPWREDASSNSRHSVTPPHPRATVLLTAPAVLEDTVSAPQLQHLHYSSGWFAPRETAAPAGRWPARRPGRRWGAGAAPPGPPRPSPLLLGGLRLR